MRPENFLDSASVPTSEDNEVRIGFGFSDIIVTDAQSGEGAV